MSTGLLGFVGAMYLVIAAKLFYDGNPGMGLAHIGYAIGNVGLIVAIKQGIGGA